MSHHCEFNSKLNKHIVALNTDLDAAVCKSLRNVKNSS